VQVDKFLAPAYLVVGRSRHWGCVVFGPSFMVRAGIDFAGILCPASMLCPQQIVCLGLAWILLATLMAWILLCPATS